MTDLYHLVLACDGLTVQVRVFRLITEGTIEERIVECAEMKLRLDALVIQQGRLSDRGKQPDKDFFLTAIRFGAERIFRGTDCRPEQWGVEGLGERCISQAILIP